MILLTKNTIEKCTRIAYKSVYHGLFLKCYLTYLTETKNTLIHDNDITHQRNPNTVKPF